MLKINLLYNPFILLMNFSVITKLIPCAAKISIKQKRTKVYPDVAEFPIEKFCEPITTRAESMIEKIKAIVIVIAKAMLVLTKIFRCILFLWFSPLV